MSIKLPTHMRYHRVAQILNGDAAIRQKLSTPEVKIQRTDGTYDTFSKEIIAITDMMHRDGKDTLIAPKASVLMKAAEVLIMNKEPLFFIPRENKQPEEEASKATAKPAVPAAEMPQVLETVPAAEAVPEAEPIKEATPEEKDRVPSTEIKAPKKPRQARLKEIAKSDTENALPKESVPEQVHEPKKVEVAEKPAATATVRIQPATVAVQKEADSSSKFKNFSLPWVHAVSIFSLLSSAHSLIEKEYQGPQKEEMLSNVFRVLEKLQQCTKIPKSA